MDPVRADDGVTAASVGVHDRDAGDVGVEPRMREDDPRAAARERGVGVEPVVRTGPRDPALVATVGIDGEEGSAPRVLEDDPSVRSRKRGLAGAHESDEEEDRGDAADHQQHEPPTVNSHQRPYSLTVRRAYSRASRESTARRLPDLCGSIGAGRTQTAVPPTVSSRMRTWPCPVPTGTVWPPF